ncbi:MULTISPECIES: multidrug efflux MFS transporter [Clostridium]|uniref:multidrug efflux MFS transporter n=1 Tax=Clostridium TaxID=1485 RepID=UPI00069E4C20|nr:MULTISPECIES: multidrug efflux MFS transporter [Clostridium]KOF57373.1 MFS transporter [Clostridium sp. DMHC 10]MCD2347081.1 multidrug efflux MFS transporter [Clostridium guangxiense]
MKLWRRNLVVCWVGMFITAIGMSQIAPILPLYVNHLGVHNTNSIEQISGIAFGVTFIVSAIFSPIWGKAADKFGRKPMLLRASLGMSIVIGSTGFATNIYQLIGLRLLQGVITGYTTACITLIATQADKEHAGWALGTLSTASVSGALLGPIIGGFIDEVIGPQGVFFITGSLMVVVFIATLIFVKEDFKRSDKKVMSAKEIWSILPDKGILITMFITAFVLQLALYSIEPIVTVYIKQLSHDGSHVALISGLAFSASGLASIISAPRLGRLSDKIGARKVILGSLIAAGVFFIPQAFVKSPWQLMGLRFLLGLATAGLIPSVNTLVKKLSPEAVTGRIFGYSMSAQYLGTFAGSVFGGQISSHFGIRSVFFVTSTLLLLNALWVYETVYKRLAKEYNNKYLPKCS